MSPSQETSDKFYEVLDGVLPGFKFCTATSWKTMDSVWPGVTLGYFGIWKISKLVRFPDLALLVRFTECTWFHLVSLSFTWCHSASLGVTWFHLVSLGFTWFHSVSLCFTWCHSVSLGVTQFHLVSLGFTRFHLVSHGSSKFDLFLLLFQVFLP